MTLNQHEDRRSIKTGIYSFLGKSLQFRNIHQLINVMIDQGVSNQVVALISITGKESLGLGLMDKAVLEACLSLDKEISSNNISTKDNKFK